MENTAKKTGLITERNETGDEWFKTFSTHVHALEKYAAHAVKSIKKDKPYSPSNPKVKNLLSTYDSVKTTEQMRKSMTSTPWRKFFLTLCPYETK